MNIQVCWGSPDRTRIHAVFNREWDWYDFYAAAGEIVRLMSAVSHPVDVILDMQASKPVPPDLMIHVQRTSLRRHNLGSLVLVQAGVEPRKLGILPRRSPDARNVDPMLFASSVEEAQSASASNRRTRESRQVIVRRLLGFLTRQTARG